MPRTEVLSPFRVILFDLHLRITESDLDDRTLRVANIHGLLLGLARSVERLVERYLLALVVGHIRTGIGVNPAIP